MAIIGEKFNPSIDTLKSVYISTVRYTGKVPEGIRKRLVEALTAKKATKEKMYSKFKGSCTQLQKDDYHSMGIGSSHY